VTIDAATRNALGRIDHALAVQDATPIADADWQPGDPLYDEPRGNLHGEQTIRPMLDLIRDYYAGYRGRCPDCEVSWVGPEPCWMCGKTPTLPRSESVATGPGFVTLTIDIDVSPFVEQMQSALRGMVDAMGRIRHGDPTSDAITDELVRLTIGGRGPDRPELVMPQPTAGSDPAASSDHPPCLCLVHIDGRNLS
jgi:hypothetical protein